MGETQDSSAGAGNKDGDRKPGGWFAALGRLKENPLLAGLQEEYRSAQKASRISRILNWPACLGCLPSLLIFPLYWNWLLASGADSFVTVILFAPVVMLMGWLAVSTYNAAFAALVCAGSARLTSDSAEDSVKLTPQDRVLACLSLALRPLYAPLLLLAAVNLGMQLFGVDFRHFTLWRIAALPTSLLAALIGLLWLISLARRPRLAELREGLALIYAAAQCFWVPIVTVMEPPVLESQRLDALPLDLLGVLLLAGLILLSLRMPALSAAGFALMNCIPLAAIPAAFTAFARISDDNPELAQLLRAWSPLALGSHLGYVYWELILPAQVVLLGAALYAARATLDSRTIATASAGS